MTVNTDAGVSSMFPFSCFLSILPPFDFPLIVLTLTSLNEEKLRRACVLINMITGLEEDRENKL